MTWITGTLHEVRYTFIIISRSVLLIMRNVSDKSYRENQNTHFVFSDFFFENRAVYETIWKNTVEPGRLHMTICRMRIACWIPKATNTHSECAILIAIPQQQRLPNAPYCYVTRTLSVFFFPLSATYRWIAEYEELKNGNDGVKTKYSDMKMSEYTFAHYTTQTEWLGIEPTPPPR